MTDDLVKRLRRDAKAAQWTTEPPESAPEVDPEDALAAADRIEELEKRLREAARHIEVLERLQRICGSARREALEEAARVAILEQPRAFLGDECCGQRDATGTCAAPACIYGSALRLIDSIRAAILVLKEK